jgi:hypothetical protein
MFAKDTVRWVDQVRSAFQHGNADRFSLETWNNLEGTRFVTLYVINFNPALKIFYKGCYQ